LVIKNGSVRRQTGLDITAIVVGGQLVVVVLALVVGSILRPR